MYFYSTNSKLIDKASYYHRHNIALKYMKKNLEPNLEIIKEVLDLPVNITNYHIKLCENILSNSITLPLPKPNTEHVKNFSKIAGPENNYNKKVSGCYRIYDSSLINNQNQFNNCYIGQSIHIGNRIKVHAKGLNLDTKNFINSLGNQGLVDLYIVPDTINLKDLNISQFLSVLEQYLFFLYKPIHNKSYVATHGVLHSESTIQILRNLKGKKVFVYKKSDNKFSLLYVFDSASMIGPLFGFNRTWIKSLQKNNLGWFRNTLLFSIIEKNDANLNIISLEELINIVKNISLKPVYTSGKKIIITNTLTKKEYIFGSISEAARKMGVDRSTLYNIKKRFYSKRDKIIYLIKFLDKN